MSSVRVYQVDAFTDERFTGNPAGVILDADGLSDQQMRRLARELGSADSAFVLAADADDHDLRVRFLTPRGEAAFIGHATLAVHAALAAIGEAPRPRQKQAGGRVRVELLRGGPIPRVAIHQPAAPLRGPLSPAALGELLEALGLAAAQLDPRCPPWLAGAGSARVLMGIDSADTLAQCSPDLDRLAALSNRLGAPGVFLFTLQPALKDVRTESRMFCPALGFAEDPVSGNAHGLLGSYLLEQGLLGAPERRGAFDAVEFTGAQGHHLDRPGRVTVRLSPEAAAPGTRAAAGVSIIGDAVIAFGTSLSF